MKDHQQTLIQFVEAAYEQMQMIADQEGVRTDTLSLMWEQKRYPVDSSQYNIIESKIGSLLEGQYESIREKFDEMLDRVIRASSIVECINSLIRLYLFLKRVVNDKFLDLLQFYFNTRKYTRIRRSE